MEGQDCQYPEDLFTRDVCMFAGLSVNPSVGPTVICINDVAIPCKAEGYTSDKIHSNFLIIGICDTGFCKVPFTNQHNKTIMGDNAKPVVEFDRYVDDEGNVQVNKDKLICYAWAIKKNKPQDKGPRIDGSDPQINDGLPVSYKIEPGMVFRCMMKKMDAIGGTSRNKREGFFPDDLDEIPAFSRLVVKLACKGWDKNTQQDMDANSEDCQVCCGAPPLLAPCGSPLV